MNRQKIFKVLVHGIGFKQECLSKDNVLGFYTTIGVSANDLIEVKKILPSIIIKRIADHSIVKCKNIFSDNNYIIEGVYYGVRDDLDIDGFSFYKAGLLNRALFAARFFYFSIFNSVRILRIK